VQETRQVATRTPVKLQMSSPWRHHDRRCGA